VLVFNSHGAWSLEGHMRRREFIELMGGLTATTALKPAFAEKSRRNDCVNNSQSLKAYWRLHSLLR